MKNEETKIFAVVIIESLKEDDKKTGTYLKEHILKYKNLQEPNLNSILYTVSTKNELLNVLEEIIGKVKNEGLYPILHFETHGSDDGIQLSSGEIILWSELIISLREINIQLRNRLIVYLGMCNGLSIIGNISPTERTPFSAILGTFKGIKADELLNAFEKLYESLFFSSRLNDAIKKMNSEIKSETPMFGLIKADYFFDEMFRQDRDPVYLEHLINEDAIKEKATNSRFIKTPFNEVKKYSNEKIKAFIENSKKKYRDFFLMRDLIE